MRLVISLFFLLSNCFFAQIFFDPEFVISKLNPNDSLLSISLFDLDDDGEEELNFSFVNYENNYWQNIQYSQGGDLIGQYKEQLNEHEEFLGSKLFTNDDKKYQISVFSLLVDQPEENDTVVGWPLYPYISSESYLSLKLFDFISNDLIDTSLFLIGTNYNQGHGFYKNKISVNNFNFIINNQSQNETKIIVGLEIFSKWQGFNQNDIVKFMTKLFNYRIQNETIAAPYVLDNCGHDYYSNAERDYLSTGYSRGYDFSYQFILKLNNELNEIGDTLLYFTGDRGRTKPLYRSFSTMYGGFYNNFPPEEFQLNPLYYYEGKDDANPKWNWDGGNFFSYSSDFTTTNYIVYSAFNPSELHNVHTNIYLKDSTLALLYFTKNENINTLWIRKIIDGKVIYSNSNNISLPISILKTKNNKQIIIEETDNEYSLKTINIENLSLNNENGGFQLEQNYPNPFNSSTLINYTVPHVTNLTINIYDVLGRKIRTLINGEKSAGSYAVQFSPSGLSSGVYYYQIISGDFIQTKNMLYIK